MKNNPQQEASPATRPYSSSSRAVRIGWQFIFAPDFAEHSGSLERFSVNQSESSALATHPFLVELLRSPNPRKVPFLFPRNMVQTRHFRPGSELGEKVLVESLATRGTPMAFSTKIKGHHHLQGNAQVLSFKDPCKPCGPIPGLILTHTHLVSRLVYSSGGQLHTRRTGWGGQVPFAV